MHPYKTKLVLQNICIYFLSVKIEAISLADFLHPARSNETARCEMVFWFSPMKQFLLN
jgi:hypothetical protein